jgi:hypothetical protein
VGVSTSGSEATISLDIKDSADDKAEVERGEAAGASERSTDAVSDSLGPEVKALIEKGKERGFVTYDELNKVLPDDMVSPEKLDAVLQKMDDLGIEMVESGEGEGGKEEAGFEPAEEEREFEGPGEREPKAAAGTAKIDDPVRLYLTQMGEIPLLSREDELRLASRIEITRKRFRTKVLESPVAVVEAISILEDVKNGDLAFDRTLKSDNSIDLPKLEVLERLPATIEKLRQLVSPIYKSAKKKPESYNDTYDFIFEQGDNDPCTLQGNKAVKFDLLATNDPKGGSDRPWTVTVKAEWDIAQAKFVSQTITPQKRR